MVFVALTSLYAMPPLSICKSFLFELFLLPAQSGYTSHLPALYLPIRRFLGAFLVLVLPSGAAQGFLLPPVRTHNLRVILYDRSIQRGSILLYIQIRVPTTTAMRACGYWGGKICSVCPQLPLGRIVGGQNHSHPINWAMFETASNSRPKFGNT